MDVVSDDSGSPLIKPRNKDEPLEVLENVKDVAVPLDDPQNKGKTQTEAMNPPNEAQESLMNMLQKGNGAEDESE